MTPQQKLVRLAQILRDTGSQYVAHQGLQELLADVHLPPPELLGLNDPEAWAKAMSATVAGLGQETALAWMLEAMGAAQENALLVGMARGREVELQEREITRASLVGALTLVLMMIDRREIRPPMVRDANDADNPPRPLREYLVEVLRGVGHDVA